MRYTKYEYWISTKSLTGRRKFLEVVCGSSVVKGDTIALGHIGTWHSPHYLSSQDWFLSASSVVFERGFETLSVYHCPRLEVRHGPNTRLRR